MSSYIDHHPEPRYIRGKAPDLRVSHSWGQFTEDRLVWLYGTRHRIERAAQTSADVAAWNALGRKEAA